MFRFIYVIMMNVFRAPYMIPKMRYMAQHPEKYSEEQRYQMVTHMIHLMQRSGRISRESAKRGRIYHVPESSGKV